jgi:hypothetical protein
VGRDALGGMVASGAAVVAMSMVAAAGVDRSRWDATPLPPGASAELDSNLTKAFSLEREMESRNRPWTESALDAILPSDGYTIISFTRQLCSPQNTRPQAVGDTNAIEHVPRWLCRRFVKPMVYPWGFPRMNLVR